jgi:putative tryptophan/tyrosine transport system substrate-binding protein
MVPSVVRNDRRAFLRDGLALAALGLLAGCGAPPLPGQQAARLRGIGFLTSGSRASDATWIEAFRHGLRELGYIEGQGIAIEYRYGEGKTERYPALATELVEREVEVIVAGGATATTAAKQATARIPLVMVSVTDPVGVGLVASLARPGGNVTGLSNMSPELGTKRLELLKEIVPQLARVAVLGDSSSPSHTPQWRATESAARSLGVQVQSVEVREPNPDFAGAFAAIASYRADALVTLSQPLLNVYRDQVVDFTAARRMPAMFDRREFVDVGGLMSYGAHIPDLYRRAATFVDKILRGAKPADLAVEQPVRFEFVLNLKTARASGLSIPPSVLQQATEILQ